MGKAAKQQNNNRSKVAVVIKPAEACQFIPQYARGIKIIYVVLPKVPPNALTTSPSDPIQYNSVQYESPKVQNPNTPSSLITRQKTNYQLATTEVLFPAVCAGDGWTASTAVLSGPPSGEPGESSMVESSVWKRLPPSEGPLLPVEKRPPPCVPPSACDNISLIRT